MKTPAGKECKYFYGDYHRGRKIEECRLIDANEESLPWQPNHCQTCPVPDILRHNLCPHLTLEGTINKGFFGFGGGVKIQGWCSEYFTEVKNPMVGCGHCHEAKGPSLFDLIEK